MVSAHPSIGFWCDYHSQITQKLILEPILQLCWPKSRKSHQMAPKWVPGGTQNRPKIDKNPHLDPEVPCWVPLGATMVPKGAKTVPQRATMAPPASQMTTLGTQNDPIQHPASPACPASPASPSSHQLTGCQRGRRQGRSLRIYIYIYHVGEHKLYQLCTVSLGCYT